MLNNWFKKEKPFAGFAGFGGGATALAFSGSLDSDGHTATGGLISDYESNGEKYRAHIFTSSGSFDVTALSSESNTVDVILVGGGGAGGSGDKGSRWSGAGGGAGGFINLSGHTITATSYPIIIGSGGSAGDVGPYGVRSLSGTNTTGFSSTAYGGGGGGTKIY